MKREKWEDKSLAERMAVYLVYNKYLKEKEGQEVSFEDCNCGWHGAWWDMIYFTFGKEEYLR